ncbi:MAG: hypothetical protein V4537_12890 [Pseudomonadota bacterium]
MFTTIALLAAAAVASPSPATKVPVQSFAPLTATHNLRTGSLCIRSGWGTATHETGRLVRRGECASANDWRRRGLSFDTVPAKTIERRIDIASR